MRHLFELFTNNFRYVGALLVGTGIGSKILFADSLIMTVFAVGFLVIGTILVGYDLLRNYKKKKAEKRLAAQLSGNSAATPGGISEAAQRAQLDELRQSFLKGLSKFRAAGKDLYTLPWYMVVGEPGSGKTEAIRRCNVGFPPGLQDEMQGSGGTINMHWWFTNHAVLLDTAGKLLFQETPPGTTTEWTEFLTLLRHNRPRCPVNGLLLVIPADTLLRDTEEDLAKKAGKIARQLDLIQRTLDVRFPVFVLITKCDLLNGFREFFAGMKDPQLQHQITGWSNPSPLDAPFHPDHVDQYLKTICHTIARRRLGLLLDPAAADATARRTDEVDSLFSLPHSIESLAPRLRHYLETVFTAGEWSAKPLFLRGIYFTSALTEGKALDMEIARAMGVTPDSLPEGKLFERERSFFLRDLFLQKIFQEKGLVTRATNTNRQIHTRQFIIGAAAALGMFAILALSIWGHTTVRDSVGAESAYWRAAATGWTPEHEWNPILTPEFKGAANHTYNGDNAVPVGNESIPLTEFHVRLQNLVARDIPVPLVFRPMNAIVTHANTARRDAQRILLDTSITRPVISAARARLADTKSPWTPRETAALAALVQLEGIIHYPAIPGTRVEFEAGTFLNPLLGLWTPDAQAPATLNASFDWTQYQDGAGHGEWPQKTLSAGSTLRQNLPIAIALERFSAYQSETLKTQETSARKLAALHNALLAWQTTENNFFHYVQRPTTTAGWQVEARRTYASLDSAAKNLDTTLEEIRATGLLAPAAPAPFSAAIQKLFDTLQAQVETNLKPIRLVTLKFTPPALDALPAPSLLGELSNKVAPPNAAKTAAATAAAKKLADRRAAFTPTFPMLQEVTALLDQIEQKSRELVQAPLDNPKPEDLARLDSHHLALQEKTPLYRARWQTYTQADALFTLPAGLERTLIGTLGDTLSAAAARTAAITTQADQYSAPLQLEYRDSVRTFARAAHAAHIEALLQLHTETVADQLLKNAAFPVLLDSSAPPMTHDSLKQLAGLVKDTRLDLTAAAETTIAPAQRPLLQLTTDRVNSVSAVLDALLTRDGALATVKIQLPDRPAQQAGLPPQTDFANNFAGNLWRTLRLGSTTTRAHAQSTPDKINELLTPRVADKLPSLELFFAADPKPTADNRYTFAADWPVLRLIAQSGIRKNDGRTWQVPLAIQDLPDSPSGSAGLQSAPGTPSSSLASTSTPTTDTTPTSVTAPGAPTVPPAQSASAAPQNYYLLLQFEFEKPLPDLDGWPSSKTLKLK